MLDRIAPNGTTRRALLRRTARQVVAARKKLLARGGAGQTAKQAPPVEREQTKLKRSWAKHDPETLDEYLVSGYQDPRVNAQSVLTRHYLIRRLFPGEFEDLMRAELQFAAEQNDRLRVRARELNVTMGAYTDPVKRAEVQEVSEVIADRVDEFAQKWRTALEGRTADRQLRVLEFACGSANDYRTWADYGIARFLDYTGVDLNEANIDNAKRRFPDVDFTVGSILELPYADGAYDYVVAFDIFEHLSLAAMETALSEAVRVAREGLALTFFIMVDTPEHTERPRGSYHWNELSVHKMRELLSSSFAEVQPVHIRTMLANDYGYRHYYNPKAWTVFALDRR